MVLLDSPVPVKAATKEKDMIDLLSITLSSEPSTRTTPLTPSSSSNQRESPASISPNKQAQSYVPYNSYVASWARPQPQPHHLDCPLQPQLQFGGTPPRGVASPVNMSTNPFEYPSTVNVAAYAPTYASRAFWPSNPYVYIANSTSAASGETMTNVNLKQPGSAVASEPYVSSNRLFDDLIDLRDADDSLRTRSMSPNFSASPSQGTLDRK